MTGGRYEETAVKLGLTVHKKTSNAQLLLNNS